ncbi:hypothetical protein SMACR_04503 [Sordaria macrospora]|uniref:WGS project CABT00000000 data, contig 2.14 n=2 Tax=Sordaria macrospora TaxID=5147 RepID=F7VYR3_SORMK|nr:uncharacterized protein SMAC_04503 [Sordaria macrospora k-hell]KAA8634569.1 hypothetical protein SMACR_04503 [Sordaria macrospora]KAH7633650.1 hypothetical protein B0T09DRAFT_381088 [Sordaria sp. MPI-SDFR-AT-0083]WPJ59968.1 hypothetical protein SMAC4_04503 [Sordaria macrospora]CCC10658.1 unnamed protein product [Sordaria macrospora k-hell]
MAGGGEPERIAHPENLQEAEDLFRKMREKYSQEAQPRTLHQRLQGKWWYRVPPNHSKPVYQFLSIGLGASMWFWIMYRAKKDGAVLLGLKHPWDH